MLFELFMFHRANVDKLLSPDRLESQMQRPTEGMSMPVATIDVFYLRVFLLGSERKYIFPIMLMMGISNYEYSHILLRYFKFIGVRQ